MNSILKNVYEIYNKRSSSVKNNKELFVTYLELYTDMKKNMGNIAFDKFKLEVMSPKVPNFESVMRARRRVMLGSEPTYNRKPSK